MNFWMALFGVAMHLLGAFCGLMCIRYFKRRRYFWGAFYFILFIKMIVAICTM